MRYPEKEGKYVKAEQGLQEKLQPNPSRYWCEILLKPECVFCDVKL